MKCDLLEVGFEGDGGKYVLVFGCDEDEEECVAGLDFNGAGYVEGGVVGDGDGSEGVVRCFEGVYGFGFQGELEGGYWYVLQGSVDCCYAWGLFC